MKKERLVGPDILRAAAIILVSLIHLINYNSDYFVHTDIRSLKWTIAVFIRYTVMLCVPIFLMLSGYFLSKRRPDRKHFTSIVTVLISWIVLTVLTNVAEWYLFAPTAVSVPRAILNIFSFSYGYTWYVEMYICLFLVIPYLNIILDNLSRKGQIGLIAVFGVLTLLPSLGKSFIVTGLLFNGFPDQFEGIYCVTYYLIGAFIARNKPEPSRWLCAAVFVCTVGLETALNYLNSTDEYAWWMFNQYSALTHAIAATALFLLFYRTKKLPRPLGATVREISVCSFEMYLISYFTDKIFYTWPNMKVRIPGIEWLTSQSLIMTCVCSFLVSYILARIFRIVISPVSNGVRKFLAGRPKEAAPGTDVK